jgi:hypothetical protein
VGNDRCHSLCHGITRLDIKGSENFRIHCKAWIMVERMLTIELREGLPVSLCNAESVAIISDSQRHGCWRNGMGSIVHRHGKSFHMAACAREASRLSLARTSHKRGIFPAD